MTAEQSFLKMESRKLWHRRFMSAMMSIGVAGVIWMVNATVQTKEAVAVVSTQLISNSISQSRDSAQVAAWLAQASAERTRAIARIDVVEARVYTLEGYHRADPAKAGKYIRK